MTAPIPDKAAVARVELEKLAAANGGNLTAEFVVQAARSKKSPLHSFFTWDDTLAAEEYRKEQARRLIQAFKYMPQLQAQRSRPVVNAKPALLSQHAVRDWVCPQPGLGYRSRDEMKNDPSMRASFIRMQRNALRSWCNAVVDIGELDELRLAIEKLL